MAGPRRDCSKESQVMQSKNMFYLVGVLTTAGTRAAQTCSKTFLGLLGIGSNLLCCKFPRIEICFEKLRKLDPASAFASAATRRAQNGACCGPNQPVQLDISRSHRSNRVKTDSVQLPFNLLQFPLIFFYF